MRCGGACGEEWCAQIGALHVVEIGRLAGQDRANMGTAGADDERIDAAQVLDGHAGYAIDILLGRGIALLEANLAEGRELAPCLLQLVAAPARDEYAGAVFQEGLGTALSDARATAIDQCTFARQRLVHDPVLLTPAKYGGAFFKKGSQALGKIRRGRTVRESVDFRLQLHR